MYGIRYILLVMRRYVCAGRKSAAAAAAAAAQAVKPAGKASSGTQTRDAGMVISNIVSLAPVRKSMCLKSIF